MSERQDGSVNETLKSTGLSYRIFKSQNVSLAKISLTKQLNLIDLSRCDKYH